MQNKQILNILIKTKEFLTESQITLLRVVK